MTTTLQTKSNQVSLNQINLDNDDYDFRMPSEEIDAALKEELGKLGQLYPVTLLESSRGRLVVLDGHRRLRLARQLSKEGVFYNEISAHIIPVRGTPARDIFELLVEKNFYGASAYSLCEKGRMVSFFRNKGVDYADMSRSASLTIHELEDLASLSRCPDSLERLLNDCPVPPMYAAMLMRRFTGWLKTPESDRVLKAAGDILTSALKDERLTLKSWRFYLDFYWSGNRPFMVRKR